MHAGDPPTEVQKQPQLGEAGALPQPIKVAYAREGAQITPLVSYVESFEEVCVDVNPGYAAMGCGRV